MPAPASRRRAVVVVALAASAACSSDQFVDPGSGPAARAFGIWTPGAFDSCTKEQHDAYAVPGPDGKIYPTWHPPTGPGGCSFGHEHGRNPEGSDLYGDTGGLPFGVANEMLAISDPTNPRDEDHFGHKVEWENDIELEFRGAGSAIFTVTCDVLTKFHQGTHSKDAFTNNVHELVYHLRCDNGTRMGITMLTAIGTPGEFVRSCDREVHVQAGVPTPANSPSGGGFRAIPDRACIEEHLLVPEGQNSNFGALHETWETSNSIRRADGHTLVHFNPYFQVRLPSRFHDPALAPVVGRPIDVCYEVPGTGERASGGPCDRSTDEGQTLGVTFDDPRSEFNGADHFVDINANNISNEGGPEVWYTDAYGRNGRTESFPGSIRQRISSVNNNIGVDVNGPTIGQNRDYGGSGVRAPN
ncbi:MAG TPA: hypothetical protein VFR72_08545 [Gemmatimonadales bacterium]|nr:hypothetical protein [Gemmatimonadales bacterium]